MRKRIWIVLLVVIVLLLVVFSGINNNKNLDVQSESINRAYDTETSVNEALLNLENAESAQIISGVNTLENKISITFDGLSDEQTMKNIIEIVNKYNLKATFFVEGLKSAENDQIVSELVANNFDVQNYTLQGEKHLETRSAENLVENFVRANVIIETLTGHQPSYLKLNATDLTDNVLKAAGASNIQAVIKSDYLINKTSFNSYEQTQGYVKQIKKGSIISIKLDDVLDATEVELVRDETPALDKQASITDQDERVDVSEPDILKIIEWLAKALESKDYQTVELSRLSAYDDPDFEMNFESKQIDFTDVISYRNVTTNKDIIVLNLTGIGNEIQFAKALGVLDELGIKATFYVTGLEAMSYPERVEEILKNGHRIENAGLTGEIMTDKTYREVYFEILKGSKVLKENFNIDTTAFMPGYGRINDTIESAALALDYKVVTYNKNAVLDENMTVEEALTYFKSGINKGDIVYFRLDYNEKIDQIISETMKLALEEGYQIVDIDTLIDNHYNSPIVTASLPLANEVGGLIDTENAVIDFTPESLNASYERYNNLRLNNQGKEAKLINQIYTTQTAVGFIFRDISNQTTLKQVLGVLDYLGAQGSFFITAKEIEKYPENVRLILDDGHNIYNGGYGLNYAQPSTLTFEEIAYEIEMGERAIKAIMESDYSEDEEMLYMPLYSDSGGYVLEAASALGYPQIVTYSKSMIVPKYQTMNSSDVIKTYFANIDTLQRGDIVYFKLNYFENPKTLTNLLMYTIEEYVYPAGYAVTDLKDLTTSKWVYTPLAYNEGELSHKVGLYLHVDEDTIKDRFLNGYIGNQGISTENELIGFTQGEIEAIDVSGLIDTGGEKALFITFDDWGTDLAINPLLDVLDKYNAKATFFVRVGNDSIRVGQNINNPNLLRAIALEGHDIGNHSFEHNTIDEVSDDKIEEIKVDTVAAHREMARYLSDTDRLKLFYRPPTLAVSKLGMSAIYSLGYPYIVNGDFSTHDYDAQDAEQLINKVINGFEGKKIEEGTVIIMHMSNNSKYTAEALDTIIPYYQSQGYTFNRLSDYLKE